MLVDEYDVFGGMCGVCKLFELCLVQLGWFGVVEDELEWN